MASWFAHQVPMYSNSHAALQWRKRFGQLIIHKSVDHLKTAYVALCPRPPAKTFAFFFGSISLSESSFFFPFRFLFARQLLPSILPFLLATFLSFFIQSFFIQSCHPCPRWAFCNAPVSPHASHHSAQRKCTSHTAHLAPSSDKAPSSKPHIYNMPRERGCFVFFLSLFPFPSLKGCLRCQLLSNMLSELAVWKR